MSEHSGTKNVALAVTGVIVVAASAILWMQLAGSQDLLASRGRDPGPAFLPRVLVVLFALSGAWLAASGLWRAWTASSEEKGPQVGSLLVGARQMLVPAALIASLLLFVALVPTFGFLSISLAFSLVWGVGLAWQDRAPGNIMSVVLPLGGSIAFALVIYVVFKSVIGVPL